MRNPSRKALSASFIIALAAGTVSVVPSAHAAPDGKNVVINEVYGGGGNSGAKYTHDFVELYNPTDQPIDVTGWTVTQRSKSDTGNGTATLSGVVPAKGYYLIQGAQGNGGTEPLPTPDAEGKSLTFSGSEAIARLIDANGTVVDLVGWGAATVSEGSPPARPRTPSPSSASSLALTRITMPTTSW
ncbi:lamin tail domain-containing protein [Corynebacterium aquatimens]|uniref:lamin tail domain-containing protein n=1 Tax=Corynebacterium aquatimens TaxID=1190508 RepID=UPI002541744F|nr:lamin tail domain-containing protein [Corynebacterium aquatimens]QYH19264.1 lamin tail domain-containing protein [Corynebacterium aquatimens]